MTSYDDVLAFIADRESDNDYTSVSRIRSKANSAVERLKKRGIKSTLSPQKAVQPIVVAPTELSVINPRAKELAILLQKLVHQNYPWQKTYTKQKIADILRRTAEDIEKINRIDKFDYDTIETVIRWSQQDNFWKQNIRSGTKLRQQFETLMVRVQTHIQEDGIEEV